MQGDVEVSGPAIILVEPQLGENIGMVGRAMANFGLSELRLVKPRDGWPSDAAKATAARAVHVIEGARLFESVEDAVADLNHLLATTARQRGGFKPVLAPVEAARQQRARSAAGQKTGILFGRERFGLDNEEIALCDAIVTFPVDPAYASLNIAQAVLLMAYEWRKAGLARESDTAFSGPEIVPAERGELMGLIRQLEEALDIRGYFRPKEKKAVMLDGLMAVLTRPGFSRMEVQVLRGIVNSLDYYSPKLPRGAGYPDRKAADDGKARQSAGATSGVESEPGGGE